MKPAFFCLFWLGVITTLSGCSSHNLTPQEKEEQAEDINNRKQGAVMQSVGIISSDDWVAFQHLNKILATKGRLTDEEFEQLLKLMQANHKAFSTSDLIVSRHITGIGSINAIRRASPDQKHRIIAVLAPLLDSPNQYEREMAKRATDRFSKGGY